MELFRKLEVTIGGWLKDAPHLPQGIRRWLSKNIWWLVVIGVVAGVFSLLTIFDLTSSLEDTMSLVAGSSVSATLADTFSLASITTIIMIMLVTSIEALASMPLKALRKRGWDLLFLASLVSLLLGIISALLYSDINALLRTLVAAMLGFYILFEIISYFQPDLDQKANTPPV